MTRPAIGQRVRVCNPGALVEELREQAGTVRQHGADDDGCWVEMERPLPAALVVYGAGTRRARWIYLLLDEITPADEPAPTPREREVQRV